MIKTITSSVLTAAITGSLLFGSIAPAFAQTTVSPRANRPTRVQQKCDRKTTQLNEAVARAQKVADRWTDAYAKLTDRQTKIGNTISQKFGSTSSQYTTWQADVNTLQQSLQTAKTDAQTVHQALLQAQTDAKNGMCGTSDGAFKTDLNTVKTDRAQLKTDTQTARTNLQTLKDFVKGLKVTITPTPTQ